MINVFELSILQNLPKISESIFDNVILELKHLSRALNEEKIQLHNVSNDISWVSPKAGKNISFHSKAMTPANVTLFSI